MTFCLLLGHFFAISIGNTHTNFQATLGRCVQLLLHNGRNLFADLCVNLIEVLTIVILDPNHTMSILCMNSAVLTIGLSTGWVASVEGSQLGWDPQRQT